MIDAQSEIFKRLAGDINVTGLLDSYGVSPAVMTTPTPNDLKVSFLPCIIVDYPLGSSDDDTYTEEYRLVDIRVRLYSKPDPTQGGTAKLNAAADAAYRSIKDWSAAFLVSATVSGPVDAPTTDPTNAGRLLNVRLFLKEGS